MIPSAATWLNAIWSENRIRVVNIHQWNGSSSIPTDIESFQFEKGDHVQWLSMYFCLCESSNLCTPQFHIACMQTLYLTAPYHYHHLFFELDGEQRNAEGETRYNISIIPTPLTDISVIIHIMDACLAQLRTITSCSMHIWIRHVLQTQRKLCKIQKNKREHTHRIINQLENSKWTIQPSHMNTSHTPILCRLAAQMGSTYNASPNS